MSHPDSTIELVESELGVPQRPGPAFAPLAGTIPLSPAGVTPTAMMSEEALAAVIVTGVALVIIGYLWAVVRAFRAAIGWGVGVLFLAGLPVFAVFRWKRAGAPVLLMLVGAAAAGTTVALNRLGVFVDLGPHEKLLADGRHLTLTGWDRSDYSVLLAKPDTVVLQMANADVTDAVVDFVAAMDELREIDLSGTAITDKSLQLLAGLPSLRVIRLRHTGVTDDGFRNSVLPVAWLTDLDVRDTGVSPKTAREWKSARDGRNILYGKTPPAP